MEESQQPATTTTEGKASEKREKRERKWYSIPKVTGKFNLIHICCKTIQFFTAFEYKQEPKTHSSCCAVLFCSGMCVFLFSTYMFIWATH